MWPWIEAMRLRTLPVSAAGVIAAIAMAIPGGEVRWLPAALCMIFAMLGQIASNFANEYYDYAAGLDRAGRDGPRRGVTEGDITPKSMKKATYATLAIACVVGCSLIYWGGWWILPAGIVIVLAVVGYSAGPYPFSRHALGEVAVLFFFGIIPVNLTYYLITGHFGTMAALASGAFGLMGANVLVVNNYRDCYDDMAVGKRTIAVVFGRRFASAVYLFNGCIAIGLMMPWIMLGGIPYYIWAGVYLCLHVTIWEQLQRRNGPSLNPLLGMTAMLMLAASAALLLMNALVLSHVG